MWRKDMSTPFTYYDERAICFITEIWRDLKMSLKRSVRELRIGGCWPVVTNP